MNKGALRFHATILLLLMAIGLMPAHALAAKKNDLVTFSRVKVKVEGHDGWFTGRSVRVDIKATVTNNTNKPVDVDALPKLVYGDESDDCIVPDFDEEELKPGKKCGVRYKGSVPVEGSDVPDLAFKGKSEYAGLHDADTELVEKLAKVKEDFAAKDKKEAREKKEREEREAAEEKKRDDAQASVEACEGKTADQALKAAKDAGYSYTFQDAFDVDVTSDVEDANNGSSVHTALVTEVSSSQGWFIFGASVTFKLDYTDPAAKKERDEEEAEEKRREAAVEALESCEGETAAKAAELAEAAEYEPTFYDSFGVDVTKDVQSAAADSDIAKAPVVSVEAYPGGFFLAPWVEVTLDYVDPVAAQERKEAETREAILGRVDKSAGKTQIFIDKRGYQLRMLDRYGDDVTRWVRKSKKGSKIRRAKVTNVTIEDGAQGEKPTAVVEIDFATRASLNKVAEEEGWPTELTLADTQVTVKDGDPSANTPTYYITVVGSITNDTPWTVSAYDLPTLIRDGEEYGVDADIELEGDRSELETGESCRFTYDIRAYSGDSTFAFTMPNEAARLIGSKTVREQIKRALEAAVAEHNANVDRIQEEERRQREEQRLNRSCYYTATGEHYHFSSGCQGLSRAKNLYTTTVREAESWGLTPCAFCAYY